MKFKANLYYAMGGGLGHLTRARAVEHTLGLDNLRVLTAAPEAGKVFHSHNLLKVPPKNFAPTSYQKWMNSRLKRYEFENIYLDTFPTGLLGELIPWLSEWEGKLHYIARGLNMEAYQSRIPADFPKIETSYIVDQLSEAQMAFVESHSKHIETVHLQYPQADIPPQLMALINKLANPIWMIAHSGPAAEVDALLAYARDIARAEREQPSWLVCTMCNYSTVYRDVHIIQHYPVWPMYEHMDRIFTACGFNSMQQLSSFEGKHHFLPFERKYDDQFARAQRRREQEE
ncbi:MAG: hypothetical protein AAF587_20850 [Bacteroidota bacterium]